MELTRKQKRAVRLAAGARPHVPVAVIPGSDAAPTLMGERWHFTTRSGRIILYPQAYSRRGWSNMFYSPSTLRVEVGDRWVAQNLV